MKEEISQKPSHTGGVATLFGVKIKALFEALAGKLNDMPILYVTRVTLIAIALVIVAVSVCIMVVLKHTTKTSPQEYATTTNPYLNKKLSEFEESLAMVAKKVEQSDTKNHSKQLQQELQQLEHNLQTISQTGAQTQTNLAATSQDLHTQLHKLEESLQELKDTTKKTIYLKADTLPFAVIAIDTIQHQSVVTIDYDYKTFPMEKGDKLAGWQLVSIQYREQVAEFVNDKQEHVVIHLEMPS